MAVESLRSKDITPELPLPYAGPENTIQLKENDIIIPTTSDGPEINVQHVVDTLREGKSSDTPPEATATSSADMTEKETQPCAYKNTQPGDGGDNSEENGGDASIQSLEELAAENKHAGSTPYGSPSDTSSPKKRSKRRSSHRREGSAGSRDRRGLQSRDRGRDDTRGGSKQRNASSGSRSRSASSSKEKHKRKLSYNDPSFHLSLDEDEAARMIEALDQKRKQLDEEISRFLREKEEEFQAFKEGLVESSHTKKALSPEPGVDSETGERPMNVSFRADTASSKERADEEHQLVGSPDGIHTPQTLLGQGQPGNTNNGAPELSIEEQHLREREFAGVFTPVFLPLLEDGRRGNTSINIESSSHFRRPSLPRSTSSTLSLRSALKSPTDTRKAHKKRVSIQLGNTIVKPSSSYEPITEPIRTPNIPGSKNGNNDEEFSISWEEVMFDEDQGERSNHTATHHEYDGGEIAPDDALDEMPDHAFANVDEGRGSSAAAATQEDDHPAEEHLEPETGLFDMDGFDGGEGGVSTPRAYQVFIITLTVNLDGEVRR